MQSGLTVSPRISRLTLLPSALKIPESSTAMYPAPTTTTFLGCCSSAKNPSLLIACSMPSGSETDDLIYTHSFQHAWYVMIHFRMTTSCYKNMLCRVLLSIDGYFFRTSELGIPSYQSYLILNSIIKRPYIVTQL